MSFSVNLEIDTGGEYPARIAWVGDPTYNVAPIFTAALGESIRALNGKTAADVIEQLRKAIADMDARPDFYAAMNPENGWGSAPMAREFLGDLLARCQEHPKTTVDVH
jgi:hypothetical protein